MTGTVQDFIAALEAKLGKPYSEVKDGGVGPDYYDCSGLVQTCAKECGVIVGRTTWAQWASLPRVDTPEPGDCIYFSVPADGGNPPQHVGVYLGPDRMIEAPHTGDVVKYATIPNSPGEKIWGYCRIAFAQPVPPPPQPQPEEDMQLYIVTRSDGVGFATDLLEHKVGLGAANDPAAYVTHAHAIVIPKGEVSDAAINNIPG